MRAQWFITIFVAVSVCSASGHAEDLVKAVRKAVERSTLDQPGTKPFHLKALLAPSFERDKESGRNGEVEFWWASPTQWKREVRCKEFHQIEIVDGSRDWQKNEGDFFPEWLRETAIELIKPVPPLDQVLENVKALDTERLGIGRMTNLNWTTPSGTDQIPNILRTWIALDNSTGLLLYGGGLDWGAEFKNYQDFHGRMIARTVSAGAPQVTATVVILEDLKDIPAGFFSTTANGAERQPLQTVTMDERSLRKNLLPMEPPMWPPVQDGPLEGKVTTKVIVDHEGRVREIGPIISDNPALDDASRQAGMALRFKPFVTDGLPVQAISQVTIPFKTVRPAGAEAFDSARTYFERGRHVSFLAAGIGGPYLMRGEFSAKSLAGTIEKGRYEDTWLSDTQWRREAWFAKSHYVRTRSGERRYQFAEGQDVPLLRIIFDVIEPIPALDTFVESDWKIKRDNVNGVRAVRVLAGYESPEGKLDPEQARGYWFDDTGLLLKTYLHGLETQRLRFEDFAGIKVAQRLDIRKDGQLAVAISVTALSSEGMVPAQTFELKGHEWTRAFTSEVR